ncbi:hypothetical protein [Streptomyces sp. NPDC050121]|uniref:hypothetical protein n=1 Tax=Streptomyces sp. NPDC050121 TaxID=3365601 RepID=UPI0037B94E3C
MAAVIVSLAGALILVGIVYDIAYAARTPAFLPQLRHRTPPHGHAPGDVRGPKQPATRR